MSEMTNLIQVARQLLKGRKQLGKMEALALGRYIMADQILSTAERLFVKGLLAENRFASEAVPIIQDLLEGKLGRELAVDELVAVVEQMGRIDRKKALELKRLLLADHMLSDEERSFVQDLLNSGNLTQEAEAVLNSLLYSQQE